MSKAELIFGTPAAYRFLAEVFGEMFTSMHTLKAFLTRAERSVPPFTGGDIPYCYKCGESTRSRKVYRKGELVNWFLDGFTDKAEADRVLKNARVVKTAS